MPQDQPPLSCKIFYCLVAKKKKKKNEYEQTKQ